MLVHGVGGRQTGVRKLILDQAWSWARLAPDADIGLFVRCEAGSEEAWRDEPTVVAVRSSRFGMPGRVVARELLSLQLARWRPDVIYLRHSTVSPSVVALALRYPMVVGGDLDDLPELRVRSRWRYWYARFARNSLLRRARAIMVHTHELARHPSITGIGRPVLVLPNSIDLDAYPELPAARTDAPRLVFIGSPHLPWSGIDKINRLARRFPSWTFDLVGPGPDEILDPLPNLHAHGLQDRDTYLPLMAGADVAIGPLALHRKGLNEISALKVMEYLAYGLPVILANAETAFPDGAPFLLQLPNAEDNVEVGAGDIERFVGAWQGRRVARSDVAAIDTKVVERRRLGILMDLAGAGPGGA